MPRERKQVGLRLPDDLHDQVTEAARAGNVSVNHWITRVVSDALDVRSAWVLDERDRQRRTVDAHTDRYPPTGYHPFDMNHPDNRPVGSFDPDTDQPA